VNVSSSAPFLSAGFDFQPPASDAGLQEMGSIKDSAVWYARFR